MGLILLVILVVLLAGSMPAWHYNRGWGYQPISLVSVLLIILLALVLLNVVPWGYPVHTVTPVR